MGIFSKDNRDDNRGLLHQILRELGELRQQVTAQQHAIDQIRHDTTAAINTGLAEIRAVVRDGLERHRDTIGDPLASIGTELVSLRAAINDATRSAQPARVAEPEPDIEDAAPEAPTERRPETDLLQAAAGISVANLQAHRDTWAFLVKHVGQDQHFHLPGQVAEADGRVTVHVSGPTIVAALTSLDHVSNTNRDPGTRAIAGHLHQRLTETVEEIITRPHRGDGADPVRIVIDDRAKAAGNEK
ncbi:hypothetical protein [Streptomyces sp. NPDC004533]|uniref:hypothetical protein n=1 Tax=Streptomyces sp. NPDC004533 TaxID=3154278 RepID=UPI0033B67640